MDRNNPAIKLWNLLKSRTLAAVMILALAVVAAAGMLKPGMEIFQTRWFALLGLLFLTNLTSCTVQQVINSLRLWGKSSPGVWGAPVFHIGLILITVGAMVSGTMKMEGHMKIAEGEVRYETHGSYDDISEGPYFTGRNHKGFGLTLLKQNITLDQNGDVDEIISDLGIVENGQMAERVSLSQKEPFIYRGLRIFQGEAGFAPFLEITGPADKRVFSGFILLETKSITEGKAEFYLNRFAVGNSVYTANIRFYPDMVRKGPAFDTAKYTLTNPGATVSIYEGNNKIAEAAIRPSEYMEFAGYRLRMGDVRHWNAFDIVNDRGAGLVFAGSWAAILGLSLKYLMPIRKLRLLSKKAER